MCDRADHQHETNSLLHKYESYVESLGEVEALWPIKPKILGTIVEEIASGRGLSAWVKEWRDPREKKEEEKKKIEDEKTEEEKEEQKKKDEAKMKDVKMGKDRLADMLWRDHGKKDFDHEMKKEKEKEGYKGPPKDHHNGHYDEKDG